LYKKALAKEMARCAAMADYSNHINVRLTIYRHHHDHHYTDSNHYDDDGPVVASWPRFSKSSPSSSSSPAMMMTIALASNTAVLSSLNGQLLLQLSQQAAIEKKAIAQLNVMDGERTDPLDHNTRYFSDMCHFGSDVRTTSHR
jgi:hypothetical protein